MQEPAPESVVPDEDNPVRGLWRLGFWLLPDGLWGIDPRRNPALAYAPWARLGVGGVALHASPWAVLAAAVVVGCLADPAIVALCIVVLPPFIVVGCFGPPLLAVSSVRRELESGRLQEAFATGASAEEVLQSLLFKPMAAFALAMAASGAVIVGAIALRAIPTGVVEYVGLSAFVVLVLILHGSAACAYAPILVLRASKAVLVGGRGSSGLDLSLRLSLPSTVGSMAAMHFMATMLLVVSFGLYSILGATLMVLVDVAAWWVVTLFFISGVVGCVVFVFSSALRLPMWFLWRRGTIGREARGELLQAFEARMAGEAE